jgi:hypothetical protein
MTVMYRALRRTAVAALAIVLGVTNIGAQGSKSMRVLFIGNSYTYFNNLPVTLLDLTQANREERAFLPVVVLVGGSTLERHLAGADALRILKAGRWDYVVLQEQSDRPVTAPDAMWRDTRTFAEAAEKVGAKVVMYETWAKEATPQLQDSLSRSYHRAAELAGGKVAHVGEAWAAFRATEKVAAPAHSALFFTDGSHPSTAGTYLAACVLYATLYGKSPEGLPNTVRSTHVQPEPGPAMTDSPRDTVGTALARSLQQLAWRATSR